MIEVALPSQNPAIPEDKMEEEQQGLYHIFIHCIQLINTFITSKSFHLLISVRSIILYQTTGIIFNSIHLERRYSKIIVTLLNPSNQSRLPHKCCQTAHQYHLSSMPNRLKAPISSNNFSESQDPGATQCIKTD